MYHFLTRPCRQIFLRGFCFFIDAHLCLVESLVQNVANPGAVPRRAQLNWHLLRAERHQHRPRGTFLSLVLPRLCQLVPVSLPTGWGSGVEELAYATSSMAAGYRWALSEQKSITELRQKRWEGVVGTCDWSGEISKAGCCGIRNQVPTETHVRIPQVIRLLVPTVL